MGGNNETRLAGPAHLRIHENSGEVHIHDDVRGTKFVMDAPTFKTKARSLEVLLSRPPFEAEIADRNGVRFVSEVSGSLVHFSLRVGPTAKQAASPTTLAGLATLDSFVDTI